MDDKIVLVSGDGQPLGSAPKAASHHDHTPLHLAFSCYLVDETGRVLITRRAHQKATFPSVRTNSACGHPGPGESLRAAVRRRVRTELGLEIDVLTLVLPTFRYQATMANGIRENELCPVLRGTVTAADAAEILPDPAEVAETGWHTWDECRTLASEPDASPWFRLQMERLTPLGAALSWPAGDPKLLPPALSW